jgi:serine O-acetyltransferase
MNEPLLDQPFPDQPPETRPVGILPALRRDVTRLARGQSSRQNKIRLILTNRGFQAVLLYRLSRALWRRHIPLLPLILTRMAQMLFAVDISPLADLGPGIVIVHGFGLVIGSEVVIEGDCCLFHGVTLGDRGSEWVGSSRTDGHPVLERNIMVGAGAKILGPIRIGQSSVIGANAVVLKDVPPFSIVAGIPARVVGQRPIDDIHY